MVVETIGLILLILLCFLGILISFFGISGTWLVLLGAVVYNLMHWSWVITIHWLVLLLVLATTVEILEFSLAGITAKHYGASKIGIIGAIIGAVLGALIGIPGLLFGSVLGLLLGAFLGAVLFEFIFKKDISKALKAGIGAFTGAVGGIVLKVIITIIMIIIVLVLVF
ncbi:DUF456 domain-containing protein [Candidatus Woesearchaeota archaeon]|nr:DUF456 domain-containing protein [Candidatus Woesearchaeota archaeon]MBW2978938.1 DUF456 domain-containing protein [Candidatus Woesearchaeota archaeon]